MVVLDVLGGQDEVPCTPQAGGEKDCGTNDIIHVGSNPDDMARACSDITETEKCVREGCSHLEEQRDMVVLEAMDELCWERRQPDEEHR
mmetsp:Transcript_44852/g.91570  ORF Transcript_44852/g.91570 Transcript_44852/m.91570 type:complete len:89 (+) Transcript_44852:63-329(+)